jgi:hypothetical protein
MINNIEYKLEEFHLYFQKLKDHNLGEKLR